MISILNKDTLTTYYMTCLLTNSSAIACFLNVTFSLNIWRERPLQKKLFECTEVGLFTQFIDSLVRQF